MGGFSRNLVGCYAIGDFCKLILLHSLHTAIPAKRILKIVWWDDDDAITNDPLRMRTTDLPQPNLT
jgi:hypothetical protein